MWRSKAQWMLLSDVYLCQNGEDGRELQVGEDVGGLLLGQTGQAHLHPPAQLSQPPLRYLQSHWLTGVNTPKLFPFNESGYDCEARKLELSRCTWCCISLIQL